MKVGVVGIVLAVATLGLSYLGADGVALGKCLQDGDRDLSCLPPQKSCYLVEHFGTLDYAGNGLYCNFNGTATKPHYMRVSKVGHQRYEIVVSSKHKKDDEAVVSSWVLMKVTRSTTSRGQWTPMPIYQVAGAGGGIPMEGWNGVKRKRSKSDDNTPNFDGEYAYNHEDPTLRISRVDLSSEEMASLWGRDIALGLESPTEKSCVADVCGGDFDVAGDGCRRFLAAAQLTEAGMDHEMAGKMYFKAVGCILERMEGMKMVPRFERWQAAETYGDLGRMMSRQGLIDEAIEEVSKGLSYSSVEVQRRGLMMDLGDLHLAKGRIDDAKQAYRGAKAAVRTKGGMVDVGGYGVRVARGSVGAGLIGVLGGTYERVRGMLVLGVDRGEDWDESLSSWVGLVDEVGKGVVCEEDEQLIEGEVGKFCKKYVRFHDVNEFSTDGGSDEL